MMDRLTTTTGQGAVRGRDKGGVLHFAGIPYAAPPTGPRRFRAPEPAQPWTGVRDATRFGPVSWQSAGGVGALLGGTMPRADEDCLSLNVQTPALDDAARPVLVWIHGGGFLSGTGATPWYDGRTFVVDHDLVVVSINYRLGALGFLHLGAIGGEAYASSGLNGILDQVAALEWVRDNIAAFGGDPGNVTIFGESAGGMSVGTLLGLPRAQGLFHRAIPQSGAAHNHVSAADAAHVTERFLALAGIDDLDQLLQATPETLVAAQDALPGVLRAARRELGDQGADGAENPLAISLALGLALLPVIDGVELTRSPLDAIRDGSSRGVDLLTGTNLDEWNLFNLLAGEAMDHDRLGTRLGHLFPNAADIVATYRDAHPHESADALWCAILTDVVFRIPAIRLAEAQAEHRPEHTFGYRFSWASTAFDGALGSCHALEIPFVFDTLDRPGASMFIGDGPVPSELATAMNGAWAAFARTGDPGHAGLPRWAPYDRDRRTTLDFGATVVAIDDPGATTRQVWDGVIP